MKSKGWLLWIIIIIFAVFIFRKVTFSGMFFQVLLVLGIALIFLFLFFVILTKSNVRAHGINKKVNVYNPDINNRKTFTDVAGLEEVKVELQEYVDFLSNPEKFIYLGARMPKGVLLEGLPGTGKTLLAQAVAGEARVPFLFVSGSDFVELFVGVGAGRIRNLFEEARKRAPCIVFIDEIDAVGRIRGTGFGGGSDEREQTLNQLLVALDGFQKNLDIVVMAATNRADVLDPALLRAGRLDRRIYIPIPARDARLKILEVHSANKILAKNVDLGVIASSTHGLTGADLEKLVNEAAILAARYHKAEIEQADFEDATNKHRLGLPNRFKLNESERKITAYHEAGHAIAILLTEALPLSMVSIIPRGSGLGVTVASHNEDKFLMSKKDVDGLIKISLAGRAAEEFILNTVTSGAQSDLLYSTSLLKNMIACGMDSEIGLPAFANDGARPFLGLEAALQSGMSQTMKFRIEKRIKELLDKYYEEVRQLVLENKSKIIKLGEELLKKEELNGAEVRSLLEM